MDRLPPLIALRAFEAVARKASFKRAAEELAVTPTAISHQIRQLETYLDRRLLNRTPRAVSLTAEGAALYEVTRAGFAEIAKVATRLRTRRDATTLTLSSTAAFLSHWLVPRLDALNQLRPRIDLRLQASDAVAALSEGGIEVAIRYGKGPFPGSASVRLCADSFIPVCSPALRVRTLDDLRRVTLLHVEGRRRPLPLPSWARWCAQAGGKTLDTVPGLRVPDSMLAVQAALAGKGIALVSRVLVGGALAAGLLEAPFRQSLAGEWYHFACAPDIEHRDDVSRLRAWFQNAMAADDPA